jgi:hypothetical protein
MVDGTEENPEEKEIAKSDNTLQCRWITGGFKKVITGRGEHPSKGEGGRNRDPGGNTVRK